MRHLEIDALRTAAILLMVVYHAAFDLWYFYDWSINLQEPLWEAVRITAVSLFLLLVGASFVIAAQKRTDTMEIWQWSVKRAAIVLGCALSITLITYIQSPETYIRFGILHMIGCSIVLMPLFQGFKEGNALMGILLWSLHPFVPEPTFTSLDYYPLIPWFGIVLLGMAIGNLLYIRLNHRKWTYVISNTKYSILFFPGRHALLIYMTHQPILLGILFLLHAL